MEDHLLTTDLQTDGVVSMANILMHMKSDYDGPLVHDRQTTTSTTDASELADQKDELQSLQAELNLQQDDKPPSSSSSVSPSRKTSIEASVGGQKKTLSSLFRRMESGYNGAMAQESVVAEAADDGTTTEGVVGDEKNTTTDDGDQLVEELRAISEL